MSVDLDANKGPTIIGVNTFLAVLSCSSVGLRFLSRYLAGTPYWFDDWMILVALPFVVGINICNFVAVHYGFGRHEAALPANATSLYLHGLYFDEIIYNTGLSCVKFSILIFYSRLFPTRSVRFALWCIGAIVLMWLISMNFTVIFQCIPIHKAWNFAVPGKCINVDAWFIGQAVPNIATDLAILAMPLPVIWTLQIPVSQKLAVCAIFMLGSFVVVVSIIRLVTVIEIVHGDIPWNYVPAGLWSAVEPSIALTCACLPTMRFLFKEAMHRVFPSVNQSRTASNAVASSASMWQRKTNNTTNTINGDASSFTRLTEEPNKSDHYGVGGFSSSRREVPEDKDMWGERGFPMGAIQVRNEVQLNYE